MALAFNIGLPVIACVALAAISVAALQPRAERAASRVSVPDLVDLPAGVLDYRASGTFTRDGRYAVAPMTRVTIARPLAVMRRQVTAGEYGRCVEARACRAVKQDAALSDRPAVNVSWRDANDYASWLTRETGMRLRLPSDDEWAYAAGERFRDDAETEGSDNGDPGRRALARYDVGARDEDVIEIGPQPIGRFGTNENGLVDLAGNVWEWTDTCFVRVALDGPGDTAATVNCGVRVVEGRHRTYMADFIGDPRGGGCSAGKPPDNLGFRLVRDDVVVPPRSRRASARGE